MGPAAPAADQNHEQGTTRPSTRSARRFGCLRHTPGPWHATFSTRLQTSAKCLHNVTRSTQHMTWRTLAEWRSTAYRTRGQVDNYRPLLVAGKGDRDRVRPQQPLLAPQRGDDRAGVRHSHADHLVFERLQRVPLSQPARYPIWHGRRCLICMEDSARGRGRRHNRRTS